MITVSTVGDTMARWCCECGEVGCLVSNIPGVTTAYDRARNAGEIHISIKHGHPPWPFPASSYDYERAGVGLRSRPCEIDDDERKRVVSFYQTTTDIRKTKP